MNRAIKRLLIDVVLLDGKRAETRDPNGGGPCGGCGEQHGYSLRSDGVHTCKGCGTERYDESPPAPAPSLEDMARRAKDLLDEPKAKRRRVLAKSRPRRKAERESKEARRERIAAIRRAVFGMSMDMCEVCRSPAEHLHHILSGPLRRARESHHNCVALCGRHHELAHRGDLDALRALAQLTRLDASALRALQYRIDKIRSRTP